MRQKLIAGNWKMNKSLDEATTLAIEIRSHLITHPHATIQTLVAPPFPYLVEIARISHDTPGFLVAGQNCHTHTSGAYTGEVSAHMLHACGATHVLVGHSERRQYFGETGETLRQKINQAYSAAITPIYCVGETLDQRIAEHQFETIATQLQESLFHLTPDFFEIHELPIIAYEPVWAIGTGNTATSEQAQEMHAFIRKQLAEKWSPELAESISILYGGSCNPANAAELFSCTDIDGGLIGGASLNISDFGNIRQAMIQVLA